MSLKVSVKNDLIRNNEMLENCKEEVKVLAEKVKELIEFALDIAPNNIGGIFKAEGRIGRKWKIKILSIEKLKVMIPDNYSEYAKEKYVYYPMSLNIYGDNNEIVVEKIINYGGNEEDGAIGVNLTRGNSRWYYFPGAENDLRTQDVCELTQEITKFLTMYK